VRPARELLADVVVAHGAIHGLEILFVRKLYAIEISVAIDTTETGVNGPRKGSRIHENRNLVVALLPHEIRVLVAHQTIFVFLCRRWYDLDSEQQNSGNDANSPQPGESSLFIAGQMHSLLQIRVDRTR
jgi:hypothetical protein